jgi:hypothetical protein
MSEPLRTVVAFLGRDGSTFDQAELGRGPARVTHSSTRPDSSGRVWKWRHERAASVRLLVAATLIGAVSGCGSSGPGATANPTLSPPPTPTPLPSSTPTPSSTPSIQYVIALELLAPLEPGTYFIDPDGDSSAPRRVAYDIPAEGRQQWIGAAKFSDVGPSGLSITTVSNLVSDGCRDHTWAAPPADRASMTSLSRWQIWPRSR